MKVEAFEKALLLILISMIGLVQEIKGNSNFSSISFRRIPMNFSATSIPDFFEKPEFFTEVEIGTPRQKIQMNLNLLSPNFYIFSNNAQRYFDNKHLSLFNFSESTTLEYVEEKEFSDREVGKGEFCVDIMKIGTFPSSEYTFILANSPGLYVPMTSNSGIIGLGIVSYSQSQALVQPINFISLLKGEKFVEKAEVFFKFDKSGNKFDLIFGLPDEVDSDLFSNDNYLKLSLPKDGSDLKWGINFQEAYYGEKPISTEYAKEIFLDLKEWMLTGPIDFNNTIYKSFFQKYILIRKCEIITDKKEIHFFYICEQNFDIKEFKGISFYNNEINKTFSFEAKDLFFQTKDKTIFRIKFLKDNRVKWIMGSIFIKKFNPVFNLDSKLIGFYKDYKSEEKSEEKSEDIEEKEEEKNNDKDNGNGKTIAILAVLMSLSILAVAGLIRYIIIIRRKNRKLRANEFEDDYTYENIDKKNAPQNEMTMFTNSSLDKK